MPRIKKDLPALTAGDLTKIEQLVKDKAVVPTETVEQLLNDLLRAEKTSEIYYSGLGPADGDFRYDANQACYSKQILVEMGEEEADEEDEEENDDELEDDPAAYDLSHHFR